MELDSLKKDWKEQKTASFDREEILKMLKKKSSSVARWILIISICEFILMITLTLFGPKDSLKYGENYEIISLISEVLGYVLMIFFVFLFFRNYRQIKSKDNVSTLLKNIMRTRKSVEYYIYSNIIIFVIVSLSSVYWILKTTPPSLAWIENTPYEDSFWLIIIVGALLLIAVFVGIIYLFYRLLYGFLLKRLRKNYSELKKLA